MLEELLNNRNMSIYECSKLSNIPYTTLREIVKGKNSLAKCNAETIRKLANALNITMEELLNTEGN